MAGLLANNYDRELFNLSRRIKYAIAILVMGGVFFSYGYARYQFVYKDARAGNLTAPLEEGKKGGLGILTNEEIVHSMAELTDLQKKYGDSLVIVPDYAAFWVASRHPNPLNIDWPNISEMEGESIQRSVREHLIKKKGSIVIAAQKYRGE